LANGVAGVPVVKIETPVTYHMVEFSAVTCTHVPIAPPCVEPLKFTERVAVLLAAYPAIAPEVSTSITAIEPIIYWDAAVITFHVVAAVSRTNVKLTPILFTVLGSEPGPEETGSAVASSVGSVTTKVASLVRIILPA
jgi:hypothetical protein